MKRALFVFFVTMLFVISGLSYAVLDDFNGNNLDPMWTYRDRGGYGEYDVEGGKVIINLKANADMYISGVDNGIQFLIDPPDMADFSIEMMVNVATVGAQPPATHVGPLLFNEAVWAYSLWGPFANTDIRLEDCVGAEYRWRADTSVGISFPGVIIDQDVWAKIVKTGDSLEFFSKGADDEEWISGGVDEKLGPYYTPGDYKIGFFAKSWGGSVDSDFEIEYFDIPELNISVEPVGRLATT